EGARPGDDRSEPDERARDEPRYALPVPVRVQADQVARRGIEQEIALREEDLVEQEKERIEGDGRDNADDEHAERRRDRAVADEAEGVASEPRALKANRDDDDRGSQDHLRAAEDTTH